ncbi:cellulose binding domain-containing protein [Paractinoplanes rhizophilus]|uniref:Cellulose binding domain-containing protein n=1 Tax=Paractinoplanes rhizophilus TaxID=1416877 RepID=A0ABW2HT71_9ACTN|nr:cellulose binding domain-containing protein [Actinoplanes sp.]
MHEKSGNTRLLPWVPTIVGVLALIGFTAVTIGRLAPGHSAPRTLPPPEPAFTLPGTISGPPAPVSLVPASSATSPAGPAVPAEAAEVTRATTRATASAPAVIRPPARPTAAPASVTGEYRILDSFDDSFIGQVLVINRTSRPQDWVVTLTYPGNLRTSWLESLPQPTLVRRGQTYTWTSSVPLAAGANGQLRFHFDRAGGPDTPSSCAVNGSNCA